MLCILNPRASQYGIGRPCQFFELEYHMQVRFLDKLCQIVKVTGLGVGLNEILVAIFHTHADDLVILDESPYVLTYSLDHPIVRF